MKIEDVRRNAYSMPLTSPSFPPGPYRFFNREYFIITYRTDPEALARVVPEPLEVVDSVVKYEFIRMPDSTGFGDYTETGQVIPVRLKGEEGAYTHAMYLDDEGPIAGGRELWGFPKKLARPKIEVESDVLVGTLHYGSVLCASATMGYKHRPVDHDTVLKGMKTPNFILKIIPDIDGGARICELVRFHLEDITLKEAWTGPAALGLFPHALADVAKLPVREVVSALHFKADLTVSRSIIWRSETVAPRAVCHAPRKRGIQYAETPMGIEMPVITGSPAFAGDDDRVAARSAARLIAPAHS
jgi:acetoacetate decarboxylase